MKGIRPILLGLALFPLVAFGQNVFVAGAVTGNGTYPTLGAAFTAINSGSQTGATIFVNITGNTSETSTATLNAGTWSGLNILPSGGSARTISGSIAGPLIDLNGADKVLIDGLNSGGNSLTIDNQDIGTSSSTIRMINDAHLVAVQNCTILGAGTATTSGTIFLSSANGTGNDTITFSSCTIDQSSTGTPTNGIYSTGSVVANQENSTIAINACNIANFYNTATISCGILVGSGNTDWTIQNCRFYQGASRSYTTANTHRAIQITSGNNHIVAGNTIGYATAAGTGTYTMTSTVATRFIGIEISAGIAVASSVQGNTITAISLGTSSGATTTYGVLCGISITGGNVNVGNITPNIIGGASGTGLLTAVPTTSQGSIVGIHCSSMGTVQIRNNVIGGLTSSGASPSIAGGVSGINVSGGALSLTISGNTIGNATANNMRAGTSGFTTGSSIATGISLASVGLNAVTVSNNTIQNFVSYGTGGSGYVRGLWTSQSVSTTPTLTITGNTISNLSTQSTLSTIANGLASALGINVAVGNNDVVSGNTISNISNFNSGSGGYFVCGITCGNGVNTSIYNNAIYGLSNASTSTAASSPGIVAGVLIRSGTTQVSVYNNMISLGNAQATNTAFVGIMSNHGSTPDPVDHIYHNTINIEGVAASGAQPSFGYCRGDFSGSTKTITVDLRNNLITNTRSGGTGTHYAIANNYGATVSAVGWTSDYNVLNAAVPGYWGADQAFAGWQTASGGDVNSYSGIAVTYVNSAGDLHLNMGTTPTSIESGGQLIASVVTDIDAQNRPGPSGSVNGGALAPDIGADEFDGVFLDGLPPVIAYTPLAFTCATSDRTLTATVSDLTGVYTTGALQPRIYFRKNAAAWFSTQGVRTSGNSANGTWLFTISSSMMGGLAQGDVISYFVIVQDSVAASHVVSNPSAGLSATDVNNVSTPPASPNTFTISGTLSGTYTVGAGGNYPTLTAAVNAYNNNCLGGPIVFSLTDATYPSETFPITIIANPDGNSVNTLTIKPAAGVSASISGASATGLLMINGADYVTIDGTNGNVVNSVCPVTAATRDLTFTNTDPSTSSAVVWLSTTAGGDAVTNCSVQNCVIIGSGPTATRYGIGAGGATIGTAGAGNDNLSFVNNDVRACQYGLYSSGQNAANKNQDVSVNQNIVNAASPNNVGSAGICIEFTNNVTVSGNTIANILATTNNIDPVGINVGFGESNGIINNVSGNADGVSNVTITGNSVSTVACNTTFSAAGIAVGNTITGTNLIQNNMVLNVAANSTSPDFSSGILLGGGTATTNVYHNTVSLQGNLQGATAGTETSACLAVTSAAPSPIDLQNNIFNNAQGGNSSSTTRFAAIALRYSSTTGNYSGLTSNHNDLSVAGAGPGSYQVGITGGITGTSRVTIADWQIETGRDLNSFIAPPVFVSATNLHLVAGSNPFFEDAAVVIPSVTSDIDCQTRSSCTPDIGADEFGTPREISVTGQGFPILDGDNTPSLQDSTDFWVMSCGFVTHRFYITNSGTTTLNISNVTVTGPNAIDFNVWVQPSTTVLSNGTTYFTIAYHPMFSGPSFATIHINNDDCDEASFDFDVQGMGLYPSMFAIPTDVTCNGGSDGSITIYNIQGIQPMTYTWSPNVSSSSSASGLSAGTYTITMMDPYFCSVSQTVTITEPPVLTATVVNVTNPTTCGGNDGSIDITENGGTSPYSFSWSNGPVTEDVSGLSAGNYSVVITDANFCSTTLSSTLNDPALPNVVYAEPIDTACQTTQLPFTLSGESPAGGTFSGPGVSGNTFTPLNANIGFNVITYAYTDPVTGCSASVIDSIWVDICNGVSTVTTGSINIYPNPTSGVFTIELPALENAMMQVEIINSLGQTVQSFTMTTTRKQIDLGPYESGVYSVRMMNGNAVVVKRIVKE